MLATHGALFKGEDINTDRAKVIWRDKGEYRKVIKSWLKYDLPAGYERVNMYRLLKGFGRGTKNRLAFVYGNLTPEMPTFNKALVLVPERLTETQALDWIDQQLNSLENKGE